MARFILALWAGTSPAPTKPKVLGHDLEGSHYNRMEFGGSDCHAELTPSTSLRTGLSRGEILRLRRSFPFTLFRASAHLLRMTKTDGSQ